MLEKFSSPKKEENEGQVLSVVTRASGLCEVMVQRLGHHDIGSWALQCTTCLLDFPSLEHEAPRHTPCTRLGYGNELGTVEKLLP